MKSVYPYPFMDAKLPQGVDADLPPGVFRPKQQHPSSSSAASSNVTPNGPPHVTPAGQQCSVPSNAGGSNIDPRLPPKVVRPAQECPWPAQGVNADLPPGVFRPKQQYPESSSAASRNVTPNWPPHVTPASQQCSVPSPHVARKVGQDHQHTVSPAAASMDGSVLQTGSTLSQKERKVPSSSGGKSADAAAWWRQPRKRNVWGSSICVELLEESNLLVCEVISKELQKEMSAQGGMTLLALCDPMEGMELHVWKLKILAAPRELLTLRGETEVVVCQRHGREPCDLQVDADGLEIVRCLHPTGHIASMFWNKIAQESWPEVCRHAVVKIMASLQLDLWQDPLMSHSLAAVQSQFSVKKGHTGFYAREMFEKPDFDPADRRTAEMHRCESHTSYAKHENAQSQRGKRRQKLPPGVQAPNVMRVVQVADV